MVSLWTVIIFDVLQKLEYAKNSFNDENAKKILNCISDLKNKDKYSSNWEIELIKKLKEKNIISKDMEVNLESIKYKRNLCAHPEINNMYQLYNPTKEEIYSFIDYFCNNLFSNNYFVSKNFDFFIKEISKYEVIFQNNLENIKKILNKQYYNFLSKPAKINYFKNLWKLCFKLIDENSELNRVKNIIALRVLYETEKSIFIDEIKINKNGNIEIAMTDDILKLLCENIFVNYIELYLLMPEAIKITTKSYCENNFIPKYKFCFDNNDYFKLIFRQKYQLLIEYKEEVRRAINSLLQENKEDEIKEFINNLINYYSKFGYISIKDITDNILIDIDHLFKYFELFTLENVNWSSSFSTILFKNFGKIDVEAYLKKLIDEYCSSDTFDNADFNFREYIVNYINDYYNINLISYFIDKSSCNRQCYERKKSRQEHKLILDKFIIEGGNVDPNNEKYSKVFRL